MPQQNEHGRLIAAAAKAALVPLGCERKGQSRFWYSDQRFWLICVEFQPSGWAKGSYLNVGANWLWHPHANWGFSEDARVEDLGFVKFEDDEQFKPLIAAMAARAAQEVLKKREKFRTLRNIYRHLCTRVIREGWPVYDAAVVSGLVGDVEMSSQLFQRLADWQIQDYEQQAKLKSSGAALARLANDPDHFRSVVAAIIDNVRHRLRLPLYPASLQGRDSTDEE